MIYRNFGTTGIRVSAIGFGGMRFQKIDEPDACVSMMLKAHGYGINYFDTAPGYFSGKSEERFGLGFREMARRSGRESFIASTKSNKAEPAEVRKDIEESLQRMGLDYVDVFHVWWVVKPGWYYDRKAKGALREFTRLKEEGLVRHIALSSHMSGDEVDGVLADYPFDSVLLGYSAMNAAFRDAALDSAARRGKAVVAMNPLGGGIIPENAGRFEFLRTQEGESVVEAAIRYLLNDGRITVVLVGFGNEAHIDESARAVEGFQPIPAARIAEMRRQLAGGFDNMCTGCGYCMPCPVGLHVPKLMQSYNAYLFKNSPASLTGAMKYGYGVLDAPLADCTRCGLCADRCTQRLPIPDRIAEMRGIVAEEDARTETRNDDDD